MKNILIIILLSIIIGGIISLYLFYKNLLPYACMELINRTDVEVEKIIIKHKSGSIIYKGLKKNEKVVYPIYVKGESSYMINVIFINNKLKPLESVFYLEAGYNLQVIINKEEITEYMLLRIFP